MKFEHRLIAVGTWITTQDIFELAEFKDIMQSARHIYGVVITGSAAAADTGLEVKHGQMKVFRGFNTSTGSCTAFDAEKQDVRYIRAGSDRYTAFPTVNATTNGVYLGVWYD